MGIKRVLLIAAAMILTGCSLEKVNQESEHNNPAEEAEEAVNGFRSPLSGEPITDSDSRAISVIINNHPDARL
ncbi:hypothetical protein [Jeotgalibacillus proteolyticus]|uniref:Uncharacterized protein n=1 Tax=Jeotgalibacillus proteolyticus TaxID=2082395 RepID=A0A2S5G7L7_9BACL|nr:hypothetical protein [Jeotgalibacillus proteolyticus]PPA68979.1 hypothetical protein C4B60_18910 [Jeotgalibacillus proteolyticus]